MGQRSRKRRAADAKPPASPAAGGHEQPEGGGRGSERPETGGRGRMERGYARGRARDDAIRASLEPLAPGERPRAVSIAAVVSLVIAIANLVGYLAGYEIDGEQPGVASFVAFELIFFAMAWGLWRASYWAVLGFEVLLAVILVGSFLGLLRASNLRALLLVLGLIATSGPLFWFLIRAMARIQMPTPPGER